MNNSSNKKRFRVALSFAGETRSYIRSVAAELKSTFNQEEILYDKYHEAEFSQWNLDKKLPQMYSNDSDLIVVFLCDHYDKKEWTGWEWEEIETLKETPDSDKVFLFKLVDSESKKLDAGDGYSTFTMNDEPGPAVKLILSRLNMLDDKNKKQENQKTDLKSPAVSGLETPSLPDASTNIRSIVCQNIQMELNRISSIKLKESLNSRLGGNDDVANRLCQLEPCKAIKRQLLNCTLDCLDPDLDFYDEQKIDAVVKSAKNILGWIAILSLEDNILNKIQPDSNFSQGLYFQLPVSTGAAVETIISRKFLRSGQYDLTKSKTGTDSKNSVIVDNQWQGYKKEEIVGELIRRIWNNVFKQATKEQGDIIDDDNIKKLNIALRDRRKRERNREHHCLIIENISKYASIEDVFKKLLGELNQLTVIAVGSDDSEGDILFELEFELNGAIVEFLTQVDEALTEQA